MAKAALEVLMALLVMALQFQMAALMALAEAGQAILEEMVL
jgi:hypothetical protein